MEHKFELGVIKYRAPNIMDGIALTDGCATKKGEESISNMIYYSRIIARMGPMIEKVDVKHRGKKIKTYKELLECNGPKITTALFEIAVFIQKQIVTDDEKKN